MNTLYRVLTVEYLRRLRWPWFWVVLVFIGGPQVIVGLIWLKHGNIDMEGIQPYSYYPPYQTMALLVLPMITLLIQWQIYPHLYSRPITTRAMAAWLMLTGCLTTAGTNLLNLLSYRLMFGADWPLLGPTMFMVAFTLWIQCINWHMLKPNALNFILGASAAVAAVWWWVGRFYPDGFEKPAVPWLTVSSVEAGIMAAASVGAILLGLFGLSRARHECVGNLDPTEPIDIADSFISSRVPHMADTRQALNWFFWKRGMPFAVVTSLVISLFLGAVSLLTKDHRTTPGEAASTIGGMMFFLPPIICLLIGMALGFDVRHRVQSILMPFLSTRPVTTVQLSECLLWNAFKSALTGWGILGLAIVLCITGFFLKTTPAALASAIATDAFPTVPFVVVGSLWACWTGLSWMAVLGWAGREKVLIAGVSVLIGLPIAFFLFLLFVQDLVTQRGMNFLIGAGAWLPAIAILLVTFDVTVMAKRAELLSQKSLYLILALAIALPIFVIVLAPGPNWGKTLACLYSFAAVLPISAAPVMLSWNRNR